MSRLTQATDETPEGGPPQTILGHLNELRIRVTYAAVGVLVFTLISFIFAQLLLQFLMRPYAAATDAGAALQTLRPTEGVETYFKVSLLSGFILAMPVVLLQLWKFIEPGMRKEEKRYVYIFVPAAFLLFALGIAFAWYILAPAAIFFLANFMPDIFTTEWTGQEYISFMTRLLLWIGLAFEFPIVIYFVARAGLVSARTLREQWRVAVVLVAVLSAVITPSIDPVTMLLTMAPMTLLYMLGIVLARIGQRQFEQGAAMV